MRIGRLVERGGDAIFEGGESDFLGQLVKGRVTNQTNLHDIIYIWPLIKHIMPCHAR